MWGRKRSPALDYKKKNRRKRVRTVAQAAILVAVGYLVYDSLGYGDKFNEPDRAKWTSDKGFIAVSYFGVSRSGTPKLIAKSQLEEQLKALKAQGYVTISQQDVIDYYKSGKKLPDKALFLSFEDGRNDSAIFAEPYLQRYNYKATFLSYADKMGNGERKFLQPKDMKKMTRTGYWELGSNGYRLSYINVVDSEGNFIGNKAENELRNKKKIDYYNHYLVDFIRDSDMIPTENRQEMEARIAYDYDQMNKIYTDKLGFVPGVYMIMHANALNEGMNPLVSAANERNIEKIFQMDFDREGDALNTKAGSLYDLTRVQPQAYWYTNHLLMRIRDDTGEPMKFVTGEKDRANDWTLVNGAAEFRGNRIALTSEAGGTGLLTLKGGESYKDIRLDASLEGNVVGKQALYVRYDSESGSYVRLTLDNNRLILEQKKPGGTTERLFSEELDPVEWEDLDLALNKATTYSKERISSVDLTEETQYPINVKKTRRVSVSIQGSKLSVRVNGRAIIEDESIDSSIARGTVAMESEYHKQGDNDDIYDGVFDDVRVKALPENGEEGDVLYENRLNGTEKALAGAKSAWNSTVDWFIKTF
ncbi:polysaccharide deacetylase family protein [Cohnella sp. AR92]|uniref:polysaccharide deacetylase family protein n=1 Tax=Cohnella sp. AR92 TaxID=648716 RepID=UPI000F8DE253|nr:polysaccharide deacetylase family protein [Cohnella sp. AR92]RUS49089.1 polysaccharide deacetylase [Cohnella sp. AR92]